MARVAGILLFAGLALGTTAGEVATAVALLAVVTSPKLRTAAWKAPVAGPLALLALAWALMALRPDGHPLASLGRIWSVAPILCAAVLPMPARLGTRLALPAALWCLAGAVLARVMSGSLAAPEEAGAGPWDHHLSATYALLGPAIAAFWLRQRREAAVLGLAVLATGSAGGAAGLLVAAATAIGGAGVAVAGALAAFFAPLLFPALVGERAVLWTAGAQLAGQGGVPPGGWRTAVIPVHQSWDPLFEFPHHAHDAFLQLVADAGPAGWLALGQVGLLLWRGRGAWTMPLAAALAVGAASQDWIGDLEAVRAAGVWLVLAGRQGEVPDVVVGDSGVRAGADPAGP